MPPGCDMSGRIIQFGTSRFLQAHVDLFVHEARQSGQECGPIAVVQVSGAASRAGRVAAFGQPGGYPVAIRGLEHGAPVDRRITVTSIDRGLSAAADWDELTRLFVEEATYVVSNTGDTGYAVNVAERGPALLAGGVPASFPGKLTRLLHARFLAGGRRLTILPCELLNRNGHVLQQTVLDLAAGIADNFTTWLSDGVIWTDTLVDRIVSEPIEPIGAVAEPYAIWVIERRPGLVLPCDHPSIMLADDLEPFERLKLHILNLGHSLLADRWRTDGLPETETVRGMLPTAHWLDGAYRDEVLPGFARHGMQTAAEAYVATTLERFGNPYLDHRIADIAQNHAVKMERRVAAFLDWVGEPRLATPVLDAALARSRTAS